jgi:hypothetical protein
MTQSTRSGPGYYIDGRRKPPPSGPLAHNKLILRHERNLLGLDRTVRHGYPDTPSSKRRLSIAAGYAAALLSHTGETLTDMAIRLGLAPQTTERLLQADTGRLAAFDREPSGHQLGLVDEAASIMHDYVLTTLGQEIPLCQFEALDQQKKEGYRAAARRIVARVRGDE